MRNDIDKLLNSFFGGGKSGGSYRSGGLPSPETMERVRRQMDKLEQQTSEDIKRTGEEAAYLESETKSIESKTPELPPAENPAQGQRINDVIEDTQNQLEEIRRRLEQDGVSTVSHGRNHQQHQTTIDRMAAFSGLAESLEGKITGQREYLKGLSIAFKRPLVMERKGQEVQGMILITGPHGSGRHEGLQAVVEELAKRGALKNGQIETLDLSLYSEQEDTKLFVQDLYSALREEAPVVALEGCESCHPAVRSMIVRLARQRTLRLDKRYVEQKGMLVEAGSALTAGAVGELCPSGKYLAFFFKEAGKGKK